MESKVSGHWTDDRLIEYLYGLEGQDAHFEACGECQARLAQMRAARRAIEGAAQEGAEPSEDASFEFLAAQRRRIYARLGEGGNWWRGKGHANIRRWVSAGAALLVVSGGLLLYEQTRERGSENRISDAQLAQEVSSMAQASEPRATAPLEVLFEQ